ERINASVRILVAGTQDAIGPAFEALLVRRVWENLRLEAAGAAVAVGLAPLALVAFQAVAAVELDSRLVGDDRERAARLGVDELSGLNQLAFGDAVTVDHEVVVVPEGRGLGELIDPLADGRRRAEVERRPFHRGLLARGDQR